MMLQNTIIDKLGHIPTECQVICIGNLVDFIEDSSTRTLFVLKGYAGTGKTSLISALAKSLHFFRHKAVLMAPTGRAAKVLSSYSGFNASTIHKCIYKSESTKDQNSKFVLNYKKFKNTLFIVDEASMISNEFVSGNIFGSGRLLEDMLEFVFSNVNCKLLIVGDTAQLPPVNTELSPALDENFLQSLGFKTYYSELTSVVRQANESGILINATSLRKDINSDFCEDFPKLKAENFEDVQVVGGADLLEMLEDSFSRYGVEETKIITRSNKYANRYNEGIRSRILWREEEISAGDLLMVVKNNYSWLDETIPIDFIANGDIIEIKRVGRISDVYGYRFADITIRFADYPKIELDLKVVLNTLTHDGPALSEKFYSDLYEQLREDYREVEDSNKIHAAILNDKFFNALQVKFAYAVTCHKSQGGQWRSVFIDYGWLKKEMINKEFYRWLYTAFTRATEKLYLINFDKAFLE